MKALVIAIALTAAIFVVIFTLAGCANTAANVACTGITDTLASPCVMAANLCQGMLKLPCYAMPPEPPPTPKP